MIVDRDRYVMQAGAILFIGLLQRVKPRNGYIE